MTQQPHDPHETPYWHGDATPPMGYGAVPPAPANYQAAPANYQAAPAPDGTGRGKKTAIYVGGALALVLLCCGGLTILGVIAGDPQNTRPAADRQASAAPSGTVAGDSVLPNQLPTVAPTPTPSPSPAVQVRTVTERRTIPFTTRTVKDSTLPRGTRKVRAKGAAGIKTLTYRVTYTNGVETQRTLLSQRTTRAPVTRIIAIGTKAATPRCHPNYSGACVPIADDVDCADISGTVRVVGPDVYRLDRDHDGYGCE